MLKTVIPTLTLIATAALASAQHHDTTRDHNTVSPAPTAAAHQRPVATAAPVVPHQNTNHAVVTHPPVSTPIRRPANQTPIVDQLHSNDDFIRSTNPNLNIRNSNNPSFEVHQDTSGLHHDANDDHSDTNVQSTHNNDDVRGRSSTRRRHYYTDEQFRRLRREHRNDSDWDSFWDDYYFDGSRWRPVSERYQSGSSNRYYRDYAPLYLGSEPFYTFGSNTSGVSVVPSDNYYVNGPVIDWCDPVEVRVGTSQRTYDRGEDVHITIRTDEDSFIYVYSSDSSGMTQQLLPNYYDSDNLCRANRSFDLPSAAYGLKATGSGANTIHVISVNARGQWAPPQSTTTYSSSSPFAAFPGGYMAARTSLYNGLSANYRALHGIAPDSLVAVAPGDRPCWGEGSTEIFVNGD